MPFFRQCSENDLRSTHSTREAKKSVVLHPNGQFRALEKPPFWPSFSTGALSFRECPLFGVQPVLAAFVTTLQLGTLPVCHSLENAQGHCQVPVSVFFFSFDPVFDERSKKLVVLGPNGQFRALGKPPFWPSFSTGALWFTGWCALFGVQPVLAVFVTTLHCSWDGGVLPV